jgi:FkbM family methyltransferase
MEMMPLKDSAIRAMRQMSPIPFLPFTAKLALAQQFRELRFLLPPGKQFVSETYLGSLKVNIDTTYPIEVEMATGTYDRQTSAILRRFVRAEDVVMDIGANVGALTLLMATLAHQGRVIAIEPGPTTFDRLQANLQLNPQLHAIVAAYAIGMADRPGELFWQEDANVPGNAGLLNCDGKRVPVTTLDQFVQEHALSRLDFVKIDVEGMEYEVIKGGEGAIAQFRPILYYETLESFRQQRGFDIYNQIFDRLRSLNYRQYRLTAPGQIAEVYDLTVLQSPNTLAIPAEKLEN